MINNVVLIGRLTKTPELKKTQSGVDVTSFTIAVDRNRKSPDGTYPTDFLTCVAWRNTAEFISKYFEKGQMIAVSGSIQTRQYDDKNGNKRVATEILVEQASFCGSKNETTNDVASQDTSDFEEISGDDDLPF